MDGCDGYVQQRLKDTSITGMQEAEVFRISSLSDEMERVSKIPANILRETC